ncbi:hypothetical protein GCM10022262_33970 [Georgenia daeguensis]|uniref:Uncharacterized protein n=1 Tax=Georgenia daeguensis TaxID=908355 RepID=A0ABP8EYJ0_9MICO
MAVVKDVVGRHPVPTAVDLEVMAVGVVGAAAKALFVVRWQDRAIWVGPGPLGPVREHRFHVRHQSDHLSPYCCRDEGFAAGG